MTRKGDYYYINDTTCMLKVYKSIYERYLAMHCPRLPLIDGNVTMHSTKKTVAQRDKELHVEQIIDIEHGDLITRTPFIYKVADKAIAIFKGKEFVTVDTLYTDIVDELFDYSARYHSKGTYTDAIFVDDYDGDITFMMLPMRTESLNSDLEMLK